MAKYTFSQFQAEYPTDQACLDAVMQVQYGGTAFTCPACGVVDSKFHRMGKRRGYACQNCGHHIYPCAGTIFEKSSTDLTKWFFAMYLMTSTRHGVAAKELQRQIGVTYKTAWRMAHELRKLMARADYQGPLSGHVEIDETLVGGVQHGAGKGKGTRKGKTIVFGIVERDGVVRAGPIPNVTQNIVAPLIEQNVAPGSTISTDEAQSYNVLQVSPYTHGTVNHLRKEWKRGVHHTNTIEGYWGHLKRSIRGTHVHVSSKHLWKYLCEFAYRYNQRRSHADMFNRLVASFSQPRLKDA
jgi:transposase-like protein/predicted RNA-binding Zn-ribbon protein involved in translation (DUF1610 family)